MIQGRYFLTTGSEKLLQEWYNECKIIEVNSQIDEVFDCLYKLKKLNKRQRQLFKTLVNEIKMEVV